MFDFVTRPEAVAETFSGWGPIPAARRSSMAGGAPLAVGAIRRVENADGSVIDEEILALQRPSLQQYRLAAGLKPPFTWLVREAGGRWEFAGDGTGTAVTWTFRFELRSALLWPLAAPLALAFRMAMRRALEETRRRLESRAAD